MNKQHAIWSFVALLGTVLTEVAVAECIITGHKLVKEEK